MYYVYIMANTKDGVLYIGMTNDLARRVEEHKAGATPGFTQKYYVRNLVYVEQFDSRSQAIDREKQLKNWKRQWKIELIEKDNPEWHDLEV